MIINSLSPLRNAMIDSLQDSIFDVRGLNGGVNHEYVTNFIGARSSYAKFLSPISVSGEYKIRVDVELNSTIKGSVLGLSNSDDSHLNILFDGSINFKVDGTNLRTVNVLTADDVVHEICVELYETSFVFTVDGDPFEVIDAPAAAAKTFTFDAIAMANGANHFTGGIRNLHVEQSSIVITSLPMSESFSEPDFANETDPLNPATKINISDDQVIEI